MVMHLMRWWWQHAVRSQVHGHYHGRNAALEVDGGQPIQLLQCSWLGVAACSLQVQCFGAVELSLGSMHVGL